MFDNLSQKLDTALSTLRGQGQITDINIASTLKEIRRALVAADVHYKIAKDFTQQVKQEALDQRVIESISPKQLFVKITEDALTRLMGSTQQDLVVQGSPSVILLAGLQGSGKTTFCAKLAMWLKKKGYTILLVAADVYRPAAIDQLVQLGERAQVDVYHDSDNKNPVAIAKQALKHARSIGSKIVIIDTAGRLGIDEALMQELGAIKEAIQPQETLFAVDAMTGQDAVNTAAAFNKRVDLTGIVLTKLDGDTRGGAALSVRTVTEKPIKFISTGEHLQDIELFHPDRLAKRILGMGDITSLVERAQSHFSEQENRQLVKKLHKNTFDLDDFVKQIKKLRSMGGLKSIARLMPGMGKMTDQLDHAEEGMKIPEILIQSMTPQERKQPSLLDMSRKKRIAAGSGRTVEDLNNLLKRYTLMQKMAKKKMSPSALASLMEQKMKK